MISSSLGYNEFDDPSMNHPFSEMDGNTTMCAIGADLAAKKGILVINSAGNEGANSWGRIITPADGDSVLAVGDVDSLLIPAFFTRSFKIRNIITRVSLAPRRLRNT